MPHADVSPKMRSNAKALRRAMTPAEKRLWNAIRAHRLEGLAFRRQMPIEGFIVDFACPSERLVIEVDGVQHADAHLLDDDQSRDRVLKERGWTVLRFWNDEAARDTAGVCAHILATIADRRRS